MDFSKVSIPERTSVLIAFIDIQSLRGIANTLRDPVELFGFLNSWAKVVIKEVDRTEGKVLKFIGDECMVVFPKQSADSGNGHTLFYQEKIRSPP